MYILHLSDLHFGTTDNADLWQSQLAEDLRYELKCEHLDALLISGDIANKSTKEEYEAAESFLDNLCDAFSIQRKHIVIVPGNHDINWDLSRTKHERRFDYFRDFYKDIKRKPYPLSPDKQGILYLFSEQKLLFLGLNSAWKLDHDDTKSADINNNAFNEALDKIRQNSEYHDWLKIAVWHHPLNSNSEDRIKDHGFMQRLAISGFRLALHGHIHKSETNQYHYDLGDAGRKIDIICAGTFGASTREWVPGYPLQYNLLKLETNKLIVETRRREELNGAWNPDARWRQSPEQDPKPRYEIKLNYQTRVDEPKLNPQDSEIELLIDSYLKDLPRAARFLAELFFKNQRQRWENQYRPPKIALYGRAGAGKSSLINAILGKLVAEVGPSKPVTPDLEPYEYERQGWKLQFIDSRGVGDSSNNQAFQQAIDILVRQKVDILLFVIPAARDYVFNDVDFLKALKQKHQSVNNTELPIILVINKIDQIAPPEWKPPYNLSLDASVRNRSPKNAKEAKENNIVACIQARLDAYKNLTSIYVPICAYWDEFGERLYNVDLLTKKIYEWIPDAAAKQSFGTATAETSLKKALAETSTLIAAWVAFCIGLLPLPANDIENRLLTIQSNLVNKIAQFATTQEDQSDRATKFLNELGVREIDSRTSLPMTLAIGKAAICYFIEEQDITKAKQALKREKDLREPEFEEAKKGGKEKVVSKLKQIDKELYQRHGVQPIFENQQR
ncbi:MAG: metallophosphoesterase [Gloeotrichia echinulata GP01]